MPSITCSALAFRWGDGTAVLDGVDLALGPGRVGLVGANGSGKTTLLRILAGELAPGGGTVRVDGTVGYLPQHLPLEAHTRVDEVIGIAGVRAALRAVEAGRVDEEHLETIGDDWDAEARARATLDRLGLRGVDLDRTIATLSGGEAVLLGVAARVLARPGVLLLDEPTNNLDRTHRRHLHDAAAAFRGVLLVASHDRDLLERVDRIVELRNGRARVCGGGFSRYEALVAQEQEAAAQAVRTAAADVRRQRRERAEAQTRLARRARSGRKARAENRLPRIVAGARKRHARPERLALLGPNGGGKTTLLRAIVGEQPPTRGELSVGVAGVGYLPQRLAVLDPDASILDNLRARAPGAGDHTLRARLARFGFRDGLVHQPAGTLSGGERFRAVLATLLGTEPPPRLLVLDEPTNNLDLHTVAELEEALAAYRGALVVATHDLPFAVGLGIGRWLHLDRDGLAETEPPG